VKCATIQAEPIPQHRRPTCAACGQYLDIWNTCPNVPPGLAALVSTARRPVYCDGLQTAKKEAAK
jgi:hypothetical protein